MSVQENKAFIRQYLAAISGQDKPPEVVDQYIADSNQKLKEGIAYSEASFPHWELIADDMVAEGDKVAVRGTIRGTHEGEWMGLAPTHKTVTFAIMRIYRIADGKIAEQWTVWDEMSLMQQLGAPTSLVARRQSWSALATLTQLNGGNRCITLVKRQLVQVLTLLRKRMTPELI